MGPRDAVLYGAVELDEADADGGEFAWAYPLAHDRAQHQPAKAPVILREPRERDALREHRPALRSLFKLPRAAGALHARLARREEGGRGEGGARASGGAGRGRAGGG